jgi:hypothetical protein
MHRSLRRSNDEREQKTGPGAVLASCVLAGVMTAGTRDSMEAFAAEIGSRNVADHRRVRDRAAALATGESGKENGAREATGSDQSRVGRRKTNDTQRAHGITYEQVLALQKELRGPVDVARAPSTRETEIVTILRRRSPPLDMVEVELVDGGNRMNGWPLNLSILDRRLEEGLLGRQDTYDTYLEIHAARRARVGID